MFHSRLSFAAIIILVAIFTGCSDSGTNPSPGPAGGSLAITGVFPDSAAVDDTVKIVGTGFGATRGTNSVMFTGAEAAIYSSWSDRTILVAVPNGTVTGTVQVAAGSQSSNARAFKLQASAEARISFAGQVAPLFSANGCTGCHGGNGGLTLTTYSTLMSGGSVHGPVVDPYNGEGSVLVRKLRGTAGFGSQMPAGGDPLSPANIGLISRWIKQGARNN